MDQENKKLKITLKRSLIGRPEKQKKVVSALGISKINQSVEHYDCNVIRGMIEKVSHLVNVE